MKNIVKKIREIDKKLTEKYPAYKNLVTVWGLEQKFNLWVRRKFLRTKKTFTDKSIAKLSNNKQRAYMKR